MSDNVQRYHAVRNQLRTMHPASSTSKRLARHLGTLGGMVAGIVAAGQVHLPKLALKAPDATKAQSRTKRFARFLRNEAPSLRLSTSRLLAWWPQIVQPPLV